MTVGKTLTSIVLAGALALGAVGCSDKDHSQYGYGYVYGGKIGEDQVTLIQKSHFLGEDSNILTVTKPDGRVIKYVDILRNDLKLEHVQITEKGITTNYTANDEVGKPILEKAQKQFNVYLKEIDEAKAQKIKRRINQGLENLK